MTSNNGAVYIGVEKSNQVLTQNPVQTPETKTGLLLASSSSNSLVPTLHGQHDSNRTPKLLIPQRSNAPYVGSPYHIPVDNKAPNTRIPSLSIDQNILHQQRIASLQTPGNGHLQYVHSTLKTPFLKLDHAAMGSMNDRANEHLNQKSPANASVNLYHGPVPYNVPYRSPNTRHQDGLAYHPFAEQSFGEILQNQQNPRYASSFVPRLMDPAIIRMGRRLGTPSYQPVYLNPSQMNYSNQISHQGSPFQQPGFHNASLRIPLHLGQGLAVLQQERPLFQQERSSNQGYNLPISSHTPMPGQSLALYKEHDYPLNLLEQSVTETKSTIKTFKGPTPSDPERYNNISQLTTNHSYENVLREQQAMFHHRWYNPKHKQLSLADFELLKTIGKGSFAKVILVKNHNQFYAMRVLRKSQIATKPFINMEMLLNEKKFLQAVRFPFIVLFHYTFQDNSNLFMIFELACQDFQSFLYPKPSNELRRFSEIEVKFYMGQLLLALEYMHLLGFIHRDVKPSNILLYHDGYVKLSDFGLICTIQETNYYEVGTYQYMAPEIYSGIPHTIAVDWWSFGVVLFEIAASFLPFDSPKMDTKVEFRQRILQKIERLEYKFPDHFSNELVDLINNLLTPIIEERYTALQIKNHCWFNQTNWMMLYQKKIQAPYIPANNLLSEDVEEPQDSFIENAPRNEFGDLFNDY